MSWLKKVGQFISSGVAIAAAFFPMLGPLAALLPGVGGVVAKDVTAITPAVTNDLAAMQSIIVNVEAMYAAMGNTNGGGAVKLKAAIPYFNSLLSAGEQALGHKIANYELFNKAVQEYAQATVDLLNSREAGSNPTP